MRIFQRGKMRFRLITLGVITILGQTASSFAYDEDTHFLMTYLACRSVGFTREEALKVAAANQGMDDSPGTVANGGIGGAIPNIPEESLWHALDDNGTMGPQGVLTRKQRLFVIAMTRSTREEKLRHLGVFFHYQQDTWAHRHHEDASHTSHDHFMTYSTPVGHAIQGHQPDRPPFDPEVAFLALEDTFKYARYFLINGLGRQPSSFFKDPIVPLDGVTRMAHWNDSRSGKYFHMIESTKTGTPQQQFLVDLIKAQIGCYTSSLDLNPYFGGQFTSDLGDVETVRLALEAVWQSVGERYYSSDPGYTDFEIPGRAEKEQQGFMNMTSADLKAAGVLTGNGGSFTGVAGPNQKASSVVGLRVNETVSINGSTDLSQAIQANDGARAFRITLNQNPGNLNKYVLNVDAQGPKSAASGALYLYFADESGHIYSLKVSGSSRKVYSLKYNSRLPNIFIIRWSNTPLL